jgi:DNA-binding NarL/FixJ family response regulator
MWNFVVRRHPGALLAGLLAATVAAPPAIPMQLPAMLLVYGIAAWGPLRWAIAGVVASGAAVGLHDALWEDGVRSGPTISTAALCAMAAAIGWAVAQRRMGAERERELLAERAAAEERLRIARELHDAVGHDVSLIVVQAQALGATTSDEAARATSERIAGLGRRAMDEMHRTLRLLRDTGTAPPDGGAGEPPLAPQPGLAALDEVLDGAREAGVPITISVEGASRPLAPALDASAFRIVQEAVTNVIRHARGGDRALRRRSARAGGGRRGRGRERRVARRPRAGRDARAGGAVRRHAERGAPQRARVRGARDASLPMSRIRVLIADDQPLMRAGFRAVLEASGFEVVAEARDGEEAIRAAERHRPDVVLMDIRMPGVDGIEATRRLPRERVLVLTTFGMDEYIVEALRAGASGFLTKDAPTQELVAAVRAVAAGDAVLSPAVTRRLLDRVARRLPSAAGAPGGLASLTEREREVLRLLAGGLSNAEIAAALVVAEPTVKTHVSNLLGKLGLRDRVQAVIYAYENGLVG